MNFNDKIILVTGASTGIGKELAKKLSKKKCKLVLVARRVELINNLIEDLSQHSEAEFLPIKCDVSNKDEVSEAYEKIISNFGRIDIAILNAGFGENMKVNEYNSELAETIFGANVFGIIYWVEKLIPDFLKRKYGMIVGVSSLADSRGFSGSGFYCSSKAAASIYLEGLRVELKPKNVKVITVKPGFVRTPMTDKNEFKMPFLMEADKAAQIILKGIKKEKRIIQFPFLTVLGSKIVSVFPEWIFEKLGK
jgi:short-subunit dehydrogenase